MNILGNVVLVEKVGLDFIWLVADGAVLGFGRVAPVHERRIAVELAQLALQRALASSAHSKHMHPNNAIIIRLERFFRLRIAMRHE